MWKPVVKVCVKVWKACEDIEVCEGAEVCEGVVREARCPSGKAKSKRKSDVRVESQSKWKPGGV